MKSPYNPSNQFQTIANASRTTGLSQYALRRGCWNHTVPHIRAGAKYMINVPLLLQRLDEKSRKNGLM